MNIGKQIKRLRKEKHVTQDTLADYLNVSAQAVSKWENEVTSPDISLLPDLSVFFGVKIDELFRLPVESHFERIESMFLSEREISQEHFSYAENFLNERLALNKEDARAYGDIAHLYNHRARSLMASAGDYAQVALGLEPDVKSHHIAFWDAYDAVCGDDHHDNHFQVIEYYKAFIEKNPTNRRALIVIIENLFVDKRYSEARPYIEALREVKKDYLYEMYLGDIALAEGRKEEALKLWDAGVDNYSLVWQSYCSRADRLRRMGDIENAIKDYDKCTEVQDAPILTDGLLSLAQIYEEEKMYDKAIEARQRQIKILKEDHGITSGEGIDYPNREIKRLSELM